MSHRYSESLESMLLRLQEEMENEQWEREERRLSAMSEEERRIDVLMPDAVGEVCDYLITKRVGKYSRDPEDAPEKFIIDMAAMMTPSIYMREQRGDSMDTGILCSNLCFHFGLDDYIATLAPEWFFNDQGKIENSDEFELFAKNLIREMLDILMPQWEIIKRAAYRVIQVAESPDHHGDLYGFLRGKVTA